MHKTQLLGEILIERNAVTPSQVEMAIESQKNEKGYLGELLVRMGFVTERDVMAALVVQCNLPYIAIDRYNIEQEIIDMIPSELASRHHIVPLEKVGDILSVVMADPLNVNVRDEITEVTHCRITPFIATKPEIDRAIQKLYNRN